MKLGIQRVTPQCKGDPGAPALGTASKVVMTMSKAGKKHKTTRNCNNLAQE